MFTASGKLQGKAPVSSGDPLFAQVVLLVNMDGANGSNTFTDSSSKGKIITRVGTPTVDGANGALLNGSSALTAPASADFLFAGDFCWEFWTTNNNTAGVQDHLNCGPMTFDGATANKWSVLVNGAGLQVYPKNFNFAGFTTGFTAGIRRHIAVFRRSGVLYIGINGSVTSYPGIDVAGTIGNSTSVFSIGARTGSSNFVNATEGPVRITNGNARYPITSFTPPAFGPFPTSA